MITLSKAPTTISLSMGISSATLKFSSIPINEKKRKYNINWNAENVKRTVRKNKMKKIKIKMKCGIIENTRMCDSFA